jgi:hypothetical protein
MRIYTVTRGNRPLAVVRAASPTDAIATALMVAEQMGPLDGIEVREPNDAEMVGWLERRTDYALTEKTAAA